MQIRTRLSLTISIISSAIFIAFGITVYLFSSNYRKHEFQERLKERVVITEKVFLEKETFSPSELKRITDQFLHTLPEENEEVILIQKGSKPTYAHKYSQEVRDNLIVNNSLDFKDEELQGTSRIFRVNGKDYLIIVTAVDRIGLQNLSFLRNVIIALILVGIPLIFIGSFIITKRALLPILKKIDKANTISAYNLHQRLNVHNPKDELGKMAIAFNNLLDRLESSFEAQKSFISNASHEIRNPLTAIMGGAEVIISKSRTNEEYLNSLKTILAEAETLNTTVTNLLQLSKVTASGENIQYEIIPFDTFLHEIKESFDFLNSDNQVSLNIVDGTFFISGNRNLLKTAIINLFDNACKFSSNNKVDVILTKDKTLLKLNITDKGFGILNTDMEKIMTPFYRGNNALTVKGSGIGLPLSLKIINLHQGTLDIQSTIRIGTDVCVKIPLLSKVILISNLILMSI